MAASNKKPDLSKFNSRRASQEINPELKVLIASGEIREVDLDLVDRDENQPRPIEEVMQDINAFADELERDNFELVQYPIYSIEPNGRYKIVVGERRTAGFKIKGKTKITAVCKTFSQEEKEKIFVMQYVENDGELKKPLSPFADAKWWRNYTDTFHGGNLSAACKARGKAINDISNRLSLLNAPEYIQQAVSDSKINDPATYAALIRLDKRAGEVIVKNILTDHASNNLGMALRPYVENVAKNAKDLDAEITEIPSTPPTVKTAETIEGKEPEVKKSKAAPESSKKPVENTAITKIENDIVSIIKGLNKARFSVRLLESSKGNPKGELTEHLTLARDNLGELLKQINAEIGEVNG